jgi:GNAT superfamily N-acetyltransferase
MTLAIRPLSEQDIPKLIEIWNLLNPDWPRSTIDYLDQFRKRDPRYFYKSWVVELNGQVIGEALSEHSISSFHPQKFLLEMYLHPDFHGQGFGKTLYQQLLSDLESLNPISLRIQVRDTSLRALKFFSDRGFIETKRDWISTLDVNMVDLSPYQGLESQLHEQDIVIKSIAEISNLDKFKVFHALFSEVRLDTPRSEAATPISYEFFMENVINSPEFDPNLFFVALHDNQQVGLTGLYPVTDTTTLDQWLTAVKREFRGKHIALALKVRSIQYAKEHGFTHIRTDNDSRNAPMLAINNKLGFVPGAASLSMAKVLTTE